MPALTNFPYIQKTAAQWALQNTIIAAGYVGIETDTKKIKQGNGVIPWNQLLYYSEDGSVTTVYIKAANGISGSIVNPGTSPLIEIELGDITPTSVNGVPTEKIEILNSINADIQAKVDQLETDVAAIDVPAITAITDALDDRVDDVETAAADLQDQIDNLPSQINYQPDIDALEGRADDIESDIATLQSADTALSGLIAAKPSHADIRGGSAISTSAVDINLTNASSRIQDITMTAPFKAVLMPDATTMLLGGPAFIFFNTGGYPYMIKDFANKIIGIISPGQSALVCCTNIGTAAGAWKIGNQSYKHGALKDILEGVVLFSGETSVNSEISIISLSSTKALVVYKVGSIIKSVVLTITINTISAGTILNTGFNATSELKLTKLDSTNAVLAYIDSGSSDCMALVLTVSGTTVSAGTPATIKNGSISNPTVVALTNTKAIVAYHETTDIYAKVITITGTSISAIGSEYSISIANNVEFQLVMLTTTKAICGFRNNSNHFLAIVIDEAATVLSIGSPVTIESTGSLNKLKLRSISSSKVLSAYIFNGGSNGVHSVILNISGSVITPGAIYSNNIESDASDITLDVISTTKAFVCYQLDSIDQRVMVAINIHGGDILTFQEPDNVIEFATVTTPQIDSDILSPNEIIVTYIHSSDLYFIKYNTVEQIN